MAKKKPRKQRLLTPPPCAGYLTTSSESEVPERQFVNGIVVVMNDQELFVGTIYNIGRDGVSFYSGVDLRAHAGLAINIDIMMYEAASNCECYIADEQARIVSSDPTSAYLPDMKFRCNALFQMLSPKHERAMEWYFNRERHIHGNAETMGRYFFEYLLSARPH